LKCGIEEEFLPNANQKFEIKIETNDAKVLFIKYFNSNKIYKISNFNKLDLQRFR
jgi:hypothetical protein